MTTARKEAIRRAFVMSVHPGREADYERRHREIWPELRALFREHGVLTYSIFLCPETLQLFAYLELESEEQWEALAASEVCRRWWSYMRDIMPTHPDDRPIAVDSREVFHFSV